MASPMASCTRAHVASSSARLTPSPVEAAQSSAICALTTPTAMCCALTARRWPIGAKNSLS
eukprot:1959415-Lingulodinium_polyedra.AAC.1